MSFKNKYKSNASKISTLVERLPFNHHINASQALLIKLTPIWLIWAEKNLPSSYLSNTQLSHIISHGDNNNELGIACDNANCATQLKHQKDSLLNAFHSEGFNNIKVIRIRMAMPFNNQATIQSSKNDLIEHKIQPSEASIRLIESCRKNISSESLSASLGRLSETLIKSQSD